MKKVFDPTKPVRTVDGRAARIVATDLESIAGVIPSPIAAIVKNNNGQGEHIARYYSDGSAVSRSVGRESDLVNFPVVAHWYICLYSDTTRSALPRNTEEAARAIGRNRTDFIGIVHITLEDGVPVSSEILPAEVA